MVADKLNLGCGRDIREGWVNLDSPQTAKTYADNGVAGVIGCDIDQPDVQLPFDDDTFEVIDASHVLEHIRFILPLVQELHRISIDGGLFMVAVPFGSSDDAWEDPTHVRAFYPGSWCYFSQPTYWRADYGYRGDWKPLECGLIVDRLKYPLGDQQTNQAIKDVMEKRNVVREMRCVLQAIKPIREWNDPGGMDRWETRVVFADLSGNNSEAAREARVSQSS